MPVRRSDSLRVYCAGPLFNQSERKEMSAIADELIAAGYCVYLPHHDGMEFRPVLDVLIDRGWQAEQAAHFLHAAIFALDVYQLAVECDAVVWNLNGRTPDEGAVSEAAIAWTLGKPVLAYKDDVRSLIAGRVNPLLVGLVDFETVDDVKAIPASLSRLVESTTWRTLAEIDAPPKLQRAIEDGRRLWQAMLASNAQYDCGQIAGVVAELFGGIDKRQESRDKSRTKTESRKRKAAAG